MIKLPKLSRQRIIDEPELSSIDLEWLYFAGCMCGTGYWGWDQDDDLKRFRAIVKGHFYSAQNRRCCYCSVEIDENRRLYDLEHIIDKNGRGDLMFEVKNLASSCVQCNLSKKTKKVLVVDSRPGDPLPEKSKDYLILHPHYDEWSSHFKFDKYERIVPRPNSKKGAFTFSLCSMDRRNIVRLADYFRHPHRPTAETILLDLYSPSNTKRAEQLNALKALAISSGYPDAVAIVGIVENDIALKESLLT